MEDIKQSETHKEKAANGVEAAIPDVQKPKQQANGLKKLLKGVLIPMSFLGLMAIVVLFQPQQNEQVTPQNNSVEDIRPSHTQHKEVTAAIPAAQKCMVQDTYKHIIGIAMILAVGVGVTIALWWHYNTKNCKVYYESRTSRGGGMSSPCYETIDIENLKQHATPATYNEIQLLRLKKDVLRQLLLPCLVGGIRSYIEKRANIAQTNISSIVAEVEEAERAAKEAERAAKEAAEVAIKAEKLAQSWAENNFDYLSRIHYVQAINAMNSLYTYKEKENKILTPHIHISSVNKVLEEQQKGMERALEAFKYNKGVCIMVAYGLWRKQASHPQIVDAMIFIIAEYGYIYGQELNLNEMKTFVKHVESEKYDRNEIVKLIDDNDILNEWIDAAQKGKKDKLIELYGSHRINIMVCSDKKCHSTVLIWSADHGQLDCVTYLVEHGADIYAKDGEGKTALACSARRGHLEIVKYLVEQGADIHAKDEYERTALHHSACVGHVNYRKCIYSQGADLKVEGSRSSIKLMKRYLDCVQYLVEQGADINAKDMYGYTALTLSAAAGYLDCVQYLVEQGADVNVTGGHGYLALVLRCASQSDFDCADYIMQKGLQQNNE